MLMYARPLLTILHLVGEHYIIFTTVNSYLSVALYVSIFCSNLHLPKTCSYHIQEIRHAETIGTCNGIMTTLILLPDKLVLANCFEQQNLHFFLQQQLNQKQYGSHQNSKLQCPDELNKLATQRLQVLRWQLHSQCSITSFTRQILSLSRPNTHPRIARIMTNLSPQKYQSQ